VKAILPSIGLGLALAAAACGKPDYPTAAPAAENLRLWEGVGALGPAGETMPVGLVHGDMADSLHVSLVTGDITWEVLSVERMPQGVGRSWPDIKHRWTLVRLALRPTDSGPADTAAPPRPARSVILRESLVLIDVMGERHLPVKVHDKIYPRIDQPLIVDSATPVMPILFALPRGVDAAALEIDYPLVSGLTVWNFPPSPPEWTRYDQRVAPENDRMRRTWEVYYRRGRLFEPYRDGSCILRADVELRNITADTLVLPDPAAARLYIDGSWTMLSPLASCSGTIAPGGCVTMPLRFDSVPRERSLELVLPLTEGQVRFFALPGLAPARWNSLRRATASGGLTGSVYDIRPGSGGVSISIGLLNGTSADLFGDSVTIWGITGDTVLPAPGTLSRPWQRLYRGFEEKRQVFFPASVSGVRIEFPERKPILLRW